MQPIVIITAPVHPYLVETLTHKGFTVNYQPTITAATLYTLLPTATGLVVTTRIAIDKKMIDNAPTLQWIGRLGSGMELIDATYAQRHNIKCISTPEGNRQAVAEHVLGMALNLLNNITVSHNQITQQQWQRNPNRGTELYGSTVGIIGYGNAGSAFAALLQPFAVKVLAYDKYKTGFANNYITEATLPQIQNEASIISLHVPLTNETKYMCNQLFFAALRQKPLLINACRGEVVNTTALIAALQSNQLSAAALDVLENENLESYTTTEKEQLNYLSTQPNVLLTPHIAGYSHQSLLKMAEVLVKKLEQYWAG